jgi:hypothetical protein
MLVRMFVVVLSLLSCASFADAAVPGNPDLKPSLTIMGSIEGTKYVGIPTADQADSFTSFGYSALLTLPLAPNFTLLTRYSHEGREIGEILPSWSAPRVTVWQIHGGFRMYF